VQAHAPPYSPGSLLKPGWARLSIEAAQAAQDLSSYDWQKKFNSRVASLRAPVERAVAHIKAWRILHTDNRRPLHTYLSSFRAAIGLYFSKITFG
jgi:hypothetical protein